MRKFETGATRDSNAEKLDYKGFLSPFALRRFAEYMHKHRRQADGSMRSSDNWKRGMPIDCYAESLLRHVQEFHLEYEHPAKDWSKLDEIMCAILFNVQGWLHESGRGKAFSQSAGGETSPAEMDLEVQYAQPVGLPYPSPKPGDRSRQS